MAWGTGSPKTNKKQGDFSDAAALVGIGLFALQVFTLGLLWQAHTRADAFYLELTAIRAELGAHAAMVKGDLAER